MLLLREAEKVLTDKTARIRKGFSGRASPPRIRFAGPGGEAPRRARSWLIPTGLRTEDQAAEQRETARRARFRHGVPPAKRRW